MSQFIHPMYSIAAFSYEFVTTKRNEAYEEIDNGSTLMAEIGYVTIVLSGTVETLARGICALVASPLYGLSRLLPKACQFEIFETAHGMTLGGAIASGLAVAASLMALVHNFTLEKLPYLAKAN